MTLTIGVLGAGQLGRMLALAGIPLGQRFVFLDPSADAPASGLGRACVAAYDSVEGLSALRACDVVTYEFENVPERVARELSRSVPVFPPPDALHTAQDRLHEKTCFRELGIATPEFVAIETREELAAALARLAAPAILKTRRFGYDGKGQCVLESPADIPRAEPLFGAPLLLEQRVHFDRELSLIAVRGRTGEVAFYPLVENEHAGGILRVSRAPARQVDSALQQTAERYGRALLERLSYVGVLTLEMFQVGGELLMNEIAPRVHNSGHWTIEGAETSQFENHLRAVTGLPLGSTRALAPCAMINLIGGVPDAASVLALPGVHLHLYGKQPRPGRKVGHITVRAPDVETLETRIARIQALVASSTQ